MYLVELVGATSRVNPSHRGRAFGAQPSLPQSRRRGTKPLAAASAGQRSKAAVRVGQIRRREAAEPSCSNLLGPAADYRDQTLCDSLSQERGTMNGGGVVRAGAEMGVGSPAGDHEALAVWGHLFVELADGRRICATGGEIGARFGRVAGQPVSREDVVRAILGLVGKDPDKPPPRPLAWVQLSDDLAQEGLALSDEELGQLPFDVELSGDVLTALDRQ